MRGLRAGVFAAALAVAFMATGSARASADQHRAYIDGRWGQIHVRVYGKPGEPTVILLHKMVWSSMEFSNAGPVLARLGVRAIAVDLPGYGLSDSPETEPSADDYADDLLPVLDYFKLKKADILGTDTGATLAVAFDKRHPDRVRRLILEGPPLFTKAQLALLLQEKEIDRTPKMDGSEFTNRIQGNVRMMRPGGQSAAALHTGAMQFFQAGPNYLFGHMAIFKYDLADALKSVTAPTLVIDFPGKSTPTEIPICKAIRPDLIYKTLDFNGQMADFDDPERWSAMVADFVKAKTV